MSSHKNELLYQEFGINYNNEPAIYRKGTTLLRKLVATSDGKIGGPRLKPTVVPLADDIIGDRFWKENPEVIGLKSLGTYQLPMNIPTPPMIHPPVMPVNKPMHQGNAIQGPPISKCSPMKNAPNDSNKQDSSREPNRNGDPSCKN